MSETQPRRRQVLPGSSASPSPPHPAESENPTCTDASFGDTPFEWLEVRGALVP